MRVSGWRARAGGGRGAEGGLHRCPRTSGGMYSLPRVCRRKRLACSTPRRAAKFRRARALVCPEMAAASEQQRSFGRRSFAHSRQATCADRVRTPPPLPARPLPSAPPPSPEQQQQHQPQVALQPLPPMPRKPRLQARHAPALKDAARILDDAVAAASCRIMNSRSEVIDAFWLEMTKPNRRVDATQDRQAQNLSAAAP